MLPVNAVFRNLKINTGTQKFWSFRKDKLCSSFQGTGALTQARAWRHLNIFRFPRILLSPYKTCDENMEHILNSKGKKTKTGEESREITITSE